MADALTCYRCGSPLTALSLPLARLDECPECRAQLHVCRMCTHYAPRLHRGCDEDDAPDVRDPLTANFCDYFKPSPNAFDPEDVKAEAAARTALASLFGDDRAAPPGGGDSAAGRPGASGRGADDAARHAAEELFKK